MSGSAGRVAHTGITVKALDASLAFWSDVLGAQVERRFRLDGDFAADVTGVPGASISAAVIDLGGHHIELLEYLAPADRQHLQPRPHDVGSWHLAVDVTDLDATIHRCRDYG